MSTCQINAFGPYARGEEKIEAVAKTPVKVAIIVTSMRTFLVVTNIKGGGSLVAYDKESRSTETNGLPLVVARFAIGFKSGYSEKGQPPRNTRKHVCRVRSIFARIDTKLAPLKVYAWWIHLV